MIESKNTVKKPRQNLPGNVSYKPFLLLSKTWQAMRIVWNLLLKTESDKNMLSWLKSGSRCKNASYEDQDTGIYCFLLKKQCTQSENCNQWRDKY